MAALNLQRPGKLSVVETVSVAPTVIGDTFANNGQVLYKIKNGANATTVTVVGQPCSHGRSANSVFATLANKEYLLGPFDPALFNDANGNVTVTVDQNVATTVAAIQTGQ
jgi:predicted CoA-binding protein